MSPFACELKKGRIFRSIVNTSGGPCSENHWSLLYVSVVNQSSPIKSIIIYHNHCGDQESFYHLFRLCLGQSSGICWILTS